MQTLVDTHCHLNLNLFQDDLVEVLERSLDAGIVRILIPGIDLETSRSAIALCEQDERLYAAVGVHPNDAGTWNEQTLMELRELAKHPRVVAIGEIGLDYYRDHAPHALQVEILHEQLALAAELGKPVVLHNRDAMDDLWPIVSSWRMDLARNGAELAEHPGVFHAFDGDAATASQIIAEKFWIGVGGPVTFKNANSRQEMVCALPIANLLLETDAPFLAPHPWRGRRNEPAYIPFICQKVAEIHHLSFEETARETSRNANILLGWEPVIERNG